jgi:hypothetical protein
MKKLTLALLFAGLSAFASTAANAAVITYEFSNAGVYNSTPKLPTDAVFATATFADTATAGVFQLTMTVSPILLTYSAYVNDWAFNVDGTITKVEYVSGTVTKQSVGVKVAPDAVKLGGKAGDNFDLGFSFVNANPGQLQNGNVVYNITGSTLTLNSFAGFTVPGGLPNGVHVQGNGVSSVFFGTTGGGNGSEVPEPTTVALLGLGLLGFAASRRKAAKNKNA